MSKAEADAHLLAIALRAISDGRYTLTEAESVFGIKIPNNAYLTKDDGFHFVTAKGPSPDYYGWAKYFIESNKFFSFDGGFYIYDNERRHYRRISEREIDYRLTIDTKSVVKPNNRNNFIRTLTSSSYKVPNEMKPPDGYLNLKNGILDVKKNKLIEHDSSLFFTYCLPHNYDAKSRCDRWMKFLDDVFLDNTELKLVASQMFGYVLAGGHPWLHQAFVLYGEGRNGKSTFLEVLKALVGFDNFSSISLSNLDKPFSVVHLDGKLANIIEETPNDKINAEAFKTAIGGGHVVGAKKYEDEYQFKCNSRFIFACNEMPKFSENSTGLLERLYFLPFNAYFEEGKRDGNINNALAAELPGILNWALSGLSILLEERRIPVIQASRDTLDVYKSESDSVYSWCVEHISVSENGEIKSRDLYNFYKQDTKDSGRHVVSDVTFFKRFKKYLKSIGSFKESESFCTKVRSYKKIRYSPITITV